MQKPLIIKYNNEVVKTLTREQLIEQVPHDPNASEYWDKVNGKEAKPSEAEISEEDKAEMKKFAKDFSKKLNDTGKK